MGNLKMVGSMFIEVNDGSGYHGVVEVAMMESPDGMIQPGGIRDATTRRRPERTPEVHQVQEAIQLAKWCYLNQPVFEGRTSNVSMDQWDNDGGQLHI